MKKIILCLLVVGFVKTADSQTIFTWRIDYMLNWNTLYNSPLIKDNDSKFSPVNFGLNFAIQPNAYNNKRVSFSLGVNYMNQRSLVDYNYLIPSGEYSNDKNYLSLNYLNIPILVSYRIPLLGRNEDYLVSGLSIFLGAGGYCAYALNGTTNYLLDDISQKESIFDNHFEEFSGLKFKKWDTGLKLSIGLGIPQSKSGISLEYQYGLMDLCNQANVNKSVKNGTLFLTFNIIGGILF